MSSRPTVCSDLEHRPLAVRPRLVQQSWEADRALFELDVGLHALTEHRRRKRVQRCRQLAIGDIVVSIGDHRWLLWFDSCVAGARGAGCSHPHRPGRLQNAMSSSAGAAAAAAGWSPLPLLVPLARNWTISTIST